MARLLMILVLATLAAAALLWALGRLTDGARADGKPPALRPGLVERAAYALLFAVMAGVGAGWLGAE